MYTLQIIFFPHLLIIFPFPSFLARQTCLARSESQYTALDLNRQDSNAMCIPKPQSQRFPQPQESNHNIHT